MSGGLAGLGILARDALRRTITAAMQAGGTRRPATADVDRLMSYGIDQVEHAILLDRCAAATREQDPHG